MKFLQAVAKDIIQKTQNTESFCVILPNNRSITYLKKYYAQTVKKTIWLPAFLTIDNFFTSLTNFKKETNSFKLIFDLYEIFKQIYQNSEFFSNLKADEFWNYGEIILNDFNEIDNYLIDPQKIYSHILDYEKLDFSDEYIDEEQKRIINDFFGIYANRKVEKKLIFRQLVEKLPLLYQKFREKLFNEGKLYPGLLKRTVIENKQNIPVAYSKYFFVGFNALTKAERELFDFFKKEAETFFYWDYDDFYVKNKYHEAGFFIRKNLKKYPDSLNIERNNFEKNKQKNIRIIGFPQNNLQAKAISKILQESDFEFSSKKLSDTVIVLITDTMLLPVLHSIPAQIQEINITTGFHIANTPLYSLIEKWIFVCETLKNKNAFPVEKTYLLLNNPLIFNLLDKDKHIVDFIKKSKSDFIRQDEINDFNDDITKLIFHPANTKDPLTFINNLLKILYLVFWSAKENNQLIIKEFAYFLYQKITALKNTLETLSYKFEIEVVFRLIRQILPEIQVPFTGKKLTGLQITTMLETRNLDFENVIILNLNEDIYPKSKTPITFISQIIRMLYGLPVVKAQDSVYAYFFYRLLQRAKNIFLLYNNNLSEKSKEKSRFIQQIEFELPFFISANLSYADSLVPKITVRTTKIKKDSFVIAELEKFKKKQRFFSASSLNVYLDCPLKFYYKYIANIPEPETFEIELQRRVIGSVLHKTLENIYNEIKSSSPLVTKQKLEYYLENLKSFVNQAFNENKEISSLTLKSGINTLIPEIVLKQTEIILKKDIKDTPFEILDTEKVIYQTLKTNQYEVKIKAVIDRMDKKDGKIRIIDYKTGKDENRANLQYVFDKKHTETHAIFQMLLYTYLFKDKEEIYEPNLFIIRKLTNENFDPKIVLKFEDNEIGLTNKELSILNYFETQFAELLNELFSADIPFEGTDSHACTYCPYSYLCGKRL